MYICVSQVQTRAFYSALVGSLPFLFKQIYIALFKWKYTLTPLLKSSRELLINHKKRVKELLKFDYNSIELKNKY